MVDLAIASNFARELTEEQFSAQPRARRAATAGRDAAVQRSRRATAAASRGAATADRRALPRGTRGSRRRAGTVLGRVLSRLVQVRG